MTYMKRFCLAFCVLFFCISSWLHAQELTVSAAGSLNRVFKEVAAEFEKQNPGVKVVLNFAAAGVLIQQIEQGAPVDIFASADQMNMDKAQQENLIDSASRRNFAQNTLVLAVPKGAKSVPATLEDLQDDVYQVIAFGRPGITPAGNYVQAKMKQAGLWDKLESRFALAEHVTQVVSYLERKEADAGFVFMTDIQQNQEFIQTAFTVSTEKDFIYPVARTKNAQQVDLANKFIEFVTSAQGQQIFLKNGFSVLPANAAP